jgi:hypothetical protein
MAKLNLQPQFLTEHASKKIASRQILSFLTLSAPKAKARIRAGSRRTLNRSLFSLDALPEKAFRGGRALFNWTSRDIYDVDGRLLFRDQTIDLGSGNEWSVRTAASNWLRAPVWSVEAGPALDVEGLMAEALAELRNKPDLEPLFVDDEEDVRLVSYSYPKLGILCYSRTDPAAKFVIDIGDLSIIPLDSFECQDNPESATAVWSPYDIVVRSTIAEFRSLWQFNLTLLPELPKTVRDLPKAIEAAMAFTIEEEETNPELVRTGQQTNVFCAAATAQMILQHHNITKNQNEIAGVMNTGPEGAFPLNQVKAIPILTHNRFLAEPDKHIGFSEAKIEIHQNRPFKIGGPMHARACGGFKVENGNKNWLHIYDPWPSNQGKIYYEAWEAENQVNYMYVRPNTVIVNEPSRTLERK